MTPLRRRLLALTCALATGLAAPTLGTPAGATTAATTASTVDHPVGLSRLLAATDSGTVRGIATLDGRPGAGDVSALESLGLTVQPMHELPLALVEGDVRALTAAVRSGTALDVYPDETLDYTDTTSSDAMSTSPAAARSLRRQGLTGKGVTVGVVDSGCDGTHPDLAERIAHNVTLLSGEYANQQPNADNTLVLPIDQGPYNNTDLGSGHGTHVGGIIAADGTSGPGQLGVAPGAKLACFAIGAVITTTAVVTAYDYVLRQPDLLGIDVMNNSWGNSFRQFDPKDPVNVATRAITREGVTVVFSAGNSGASNGEASVSPFNQAPWVISVAAGTVDRKRGDFSSNGLMFDNTRPVAIGEGGHTVAKGDRVGLVHPDIMAPGVDISSSCDSTGTVIGPCPQHGNTAASGTSMSSPHIAGAAAVLYQARRTITPKQVQRALFATASRVRDDKGRALPFWQVGHGHVNLDRAVELVSERGWRQKLRVAGRKADRRALRSDDWRVLRSDTWQYAAPPVTLGGSDSATYRLRVGEDTRRVHLTLVYPTPGTAANVASYTASLVAPNGRVVDTTTTDVGYALGVATLDAKVRRAGRYTIEVVGDYAVSDPDTIDSDSINGRVVYVNATQRRRS